MKRSGKASSSSALAAEEESLRRYLRCLPFLRHEVARRTPFAWPKRACPHKARLTENLQPQVLQAASLRSAGGMRVRTGRKKLYGGGEKKKEKKSHNWA